MILRDFDYYLREWRDAALQADDFKVDYGSPTSVRMHNRAVDKYRKIAKLIGKNYPDRIEEFATNLDDHNEEIRVTAAISLVELMPHTKAHLSKAKSIIAERMLNPANITLIGWNWWLSQPWCDESNCKDYTAKK